MRLKIIETNFTKNHDWLFKLTDESGVEFYIMNEIFYKKHKIKSPVTKIELDVYDVGQWIDALVKNLDGKGIVIRV